MLKRCAFVFAFVVVPCAGDGAAAQSVSAPQTPAMRRFGGIPFGTSGSRLVHPNGSTCTPSPVSYGNGPLVSNVQVVPVFWGSSVDSSITTNIPQFLADMSVSRWYDMLSEYASVGGTNQSIGRGTVVPAITITPSACGVTCTDSQIQTELSKQITNSVLPQPQQDAAGNTNTLYMLHFPGGVNVNDGTGSFSCSGFLGYHSSFTFGSSSAAVPYAVIASCPPFPGGPSLLQEVTDTVSHELAEVATDPSMTSQGWLDLSCGDEIADICDTGSGDPYTVNGRTWSVAPLWSNALNACGTTGLNPTYIVAAPSTAAAGSPVTFTVTAQNPAGNKGTDIAYVGTVHFTSSDPAAVLPADFTYIPEDNGTYAFSATLLSPGTQTITATDTLNGKIVGTSGPIIVSTVPSQCSGTNNYNVPFFDDFAGIGLNPNHWTTNANGGTVTVANNAVAVTASNGSAFPYVTAVGSPIPASGNFSVRWIATYGPRLPAGTGSLALVPALPANGATSWLDVADAWQDQNGYRVQVQSSASSQMNAYSDGSPTTTAHDVEYCWLSGTMEVYVDGTRQLQQARDPNVPRPTTLWFGNPGNSTNNWQPFTLSHVEVRSLNDEIFRDGFGN